MEILKKYIKTKFQKSEPELDLTNLPIHVGIIMDGNGRWAKKRGLPRTVGHKSGAVVLKNIAKYANEIGIPYLTVYAFSTENWSRPEAEISALMKLLEDYLDESLKEADKDEICFRVLGDLTQLTSSLQDKILELEAFTNKKQGTTLNIALNYGGRNEIVQAVKKILVEFQSKKISVEDVNESSIEKFLYTAGMPEVDLIIRPSGEYRLSNFLLWQSAYAEFYYDNVLWPDYTKEDFNRALLAYQNRHRRFGGL